MAQISYPWANGTLTEDDWELMAPIWGRKGVVAGSGSGGELAVSHVSATSVQVAAGACWFGGHYYENSAPQTVTHALSGTIYVVLSLGTNSATTVLSTTNSPTSSHLVLASDVVASGTLVDLRTYANETALSFVIGTGFDIPAAGDLPTAIPIPFGGKIVRWEMIGDVQGSMSIQLKKYSSLTNWPSTSTNLFATSLTNQLYSSARVSAANTFSAGDYIRVNISSAVTSIKQAVLTLYIAPLITS